MRLKNIILDFFEGFGGYWLEIVEFITGFPSDVRTYDAYDVGELAAFLSFILLLVSIGVLM